MQNLSKIDTAKDLVTKEWVEAQDFLPSSAFTKTGIKNALGIADWALAASKPSYDDVYLKLAGGTISGALLVNSTLTTSGSIYCNANIKINAGGKLILGNDEGITSWSDLKSKIAYSFSEISSKPTTLSGYGITDGVIYSNNIDVSSNASFKHIGYGYANKGWWDTEGPSMAFGAHDGTYVKLSFPNYNEYYQNRIVYQHRRNGVTGDWIEIITKKTIGEYAVRISNQGTTLLPTHNESVCTFVTGKNGWKATGAAMIVNTGGVYTGLFNFQGYNTSDLTQYPRLFINVNHDGVVGQWAEVLTDKNIGDYAMSKADGISKDTYLMPTNSFDHSGRLEHSYAANALYAADKRFSVSGSGFSYFNANQLFDGSYEGGYCARVETGATATMTISNNGSSIIAGYPYGDIYLSFYYNNVPADVKVEVYCNYASQGIGWKTLTLGGKRGDYNDVWYYNNSYYNVTQLRITITASASIAAALTEIDWHLSRAALSNLPIVTKFGIDQELWGRLICQGGITLGGRTISNWDQVRMTAYALTATTGSQSLSPNAHYTFSNALTSSSNISITLTDDTSGESITKIYYIVFRTGSTTPTFTFNRTLYWKDGKTLTSLAANKRYRIVIDGNLATLETYS